VTAPHESVAAPRHGRVTLLTLNTLGVPFVRDTRARMRAVAREVDAGIADLLCLQEIQLQSYVALLDQGLSRFAHAAFEPFLYSPKGGLLTFSRWPIHESEFVLYDERGSWRSPAIADRLLHKGLLAATVEVAGHLLVVVNTHLTANYDGDWSTGNRYARIERAQLVQLAAYVRGVPADRTVVVVGDLNVPRHSELYDDLVVAAGLVDPLAGNLEPTYQPFVAFPSRYLQPIDHVLIRPAAGDAPIATAESAFHQPVTLRGGRVGRVSDHIGILVELAWRGA
jgi:endonuclease/exonuclease/phosphatase (EEP) superfamily protein YafD